jgi:predicted permease
MNWLSQLFSRRRLYGDLSDEIEQHLEEKIEELVAAGMPREEATVAARREFGNVTSLTERSREVWQWPWIENFLMDIRYALRQLRRKPGFTAVAVLTLALGIGANTAIFTIINAVLLNPLPVRNVSRLVQLDTVDQKTFVALGNATKLGVSFPNYRDYARDAHVFSGLAAYQPTGLTLTGRGHPKQLFGMLVTANYFDVLGVRAVLGRTFRPDEDLAPGGNAVAVLSYGMWSREFGQDPAIIGKQISLNQTSYTVIGVTSPGFKGTRLLANGEVIWIPVSMHSQVLSGFIEQNFEDRRFLDFFSFGRLKPGVSIEQAQAAVQTVASRLETQFPKDNVGRSAVLSPLADAAVGINRRGQMTLAGGVLMGIVGLVLLIACVNLANLLLSQMARRENEMCLRAALGADRRRLVRQSLTESSVLAFLGGAAGLAIAFWGKELLWSLRPAFMAQADLALPLSGRVLAFTLGLILVTGILFGLAPALKASHPDLNEALKGGGRSATMAWGRNRFRQLLVVSEVALALIALTAAGLFLRSLAFADGIDPGFVTTRLFIVSFDLESEHLSRDRGEQFFRDAIARAEAVPGVRSAAIASNPPLGGGIAKTIFLEGQTETTGARGTLTLVNDISDGYFQALGIPLKGGRTFNDLDRKSTTPVAIVNSATARHFWPGQNPMGKRFHFIGDSTLWQVVGEVGDTVQFQIGEAPQPVVYLPLTQDYSPFATLHVRTLGNPSAVVLAVHRQLQSLDPNLALIFEQTIGGVMRDALWAPRTGAVLLGVFAALALVLASVGIFGVLSGSVSHRVREIGMRMALGAAPGQVLRLVVGQGMSLALAGVGIGILGALVLMRFLSSLLFGIRPWDPLTFVLVPLVLSGVALIACYIPARRAARVDPMVALRYE